MSVGKICVREVDVADLDESAQVAAARMHSRKVGTLVVLNEQKQPIGILTDRDLAVRVVAEALDAGQTTVGAVMTRCPTTVRDDSAIEDALAVMRAGPYRRVPVVDQKAVLVGLLSLDDVLDLLCEEFGVIGGLLARESPQSLASP